MGAVWHAPTLKSAAWYACDDRAQLRIKRQAQIMYAGALAVKQAFPGARWRRGAEADFQHLAGLILHVYEDQRDQFLWSSLLERETERLLVYHWYAVGAVALALLEHRTLSGRQIKEIIILAAQERAMRWQVEPADAQDRPGQPAAV